MACETGCAGGNVPVLGTVGENLTNIMSPLINGGMPLINLIYKRALGVMDFMFEKVESIDSQGFKVLNYKFKETMGSGAKFQYVRTNDNCQLEWREQFYSAPSAKVTVAATNTDLITVDNIAGLRGIGARSKIILSVAGKIISATVESVSGNVINLTAPIASAPIGTCIYRGAYSRSKDCDARISNKYDLRQEVKYVSNFRNISLSLEFFTCDLSLDRFVNYLGDNGTNRFINEQKQAAVEGFVDEFRAAFWMDRNLKAGVNVDGNTVDTTFPNETQGLIPAIHRAQTLLNRTLIVDHSECCDPLAACSGDSAVVSGFFDIIRSAHKSGLYTNNVVSVVGNAKFIENVQKMGAAFQDVNGVNVIYNDPMMTDGYTVRQTLPSINLGGILVEFMYDEYLDRLSEESLYVVLPKDQMYFVQRAYGALDGQMTATNAINGEISTGFPRLKFVDRTAFETNGTGDCYKYFSDFEFAVAFGGIDHGAYYIGKNF